MLSVGQICRSTRVSLGAAAVFAVTALGCDSTKGPLIVRQHAGGAGGAGASAGNSGVAGSAGVAQGGTLARLATDVSWQVQLSGAFDATVDASLYYVDVDNLTAPELRALTAQGRHVACYQSAGTYEPWRSDAALFPAEVLGNAVVDYPNERWVDTRSSVVVSLMNARLDRLKDAGCASVVVANVTNSGMDTGFAVTAAEQMSYLVQLSEQIHQRGLVAGLATAEDRVAEVEPFFDWAYAQDCWVADKCASYSPFVDVGKAVLGVAFGDGTTAASLCAGATGSGINLLVKPQDLGPFRFACSP